MPDPIRVTRAVRLCEHHDGSRYRAISCPCAPDANGVTHHNSWCHTRCECQGTGWVDVPVDRSCDSCGGTATLSYESGSRVVTNGNGTCPDCGGSGRRLHDWATGWCVGDEALTHWIEGGREVCAPIIVRTLSIDGECYAENNWEYEGPVTDLALVLSDPSHRPEPMRWKQ